MKCLIGVIASAMLLSACAAVPQQKYDWGNYEMALYDYNTSLEETDELMKALSVTIAKAETTKHLVAPGLYAELGFLLVLQRKPREAIANFEIERYRWPASTVIMNRMILLAQEQAAKLEAKQ